MTSVNPQSNHLNSADLPSTQTSTSKPQSVSDVDSSYQIHTPLPFSRLERILFGVLEFLSSLFRNRLTRPKARMDLDLGARPCQLSGNRYMAGTPLMAGVRDWYCRVTGRC
ncbi:MAG: hypothetical protein AAGF01_29520 [Cyanobacteria bacterium P01_G01_bin.38]